jgi:hypothetical protein
MRGLLFVCLLTSLLLILGGCTKRGGVSVARDPCSLISKEEVGSVQSSVVTDTKSSERLDDLFRFAECFYTTAESNKAVNLALVQQRADQQSKSSPRDFWKKKFDPYKDEEPKTKNGGDKEQGSAPKKINHLGDDAYWASNRLGGTLYVLKGDAFISIGLSGTDDEQTKLKKSKTLAQKALQRL